MENCIPCLVDDALNARFTLLPSIKEIRATIFSLNFDNAYGPDGFGVNFCQSYWNIIKKEVADVVLHFFYSGWISHDFNSRVLVLILKTDSADACPFLFPLRSMSLFRTRT